MPTEQHQDYKSDDLTIEHIWTGCAEGFTDSLNVFFFVLVSFFYPISNYLHTCSYLLYFQ